ncbi:class I SAM-dependent methyltransferase [Mycolicibacterium obuense]|uniref:Class I SAM-dependent methyltransferase n=1 Tax=Mycolicibacterium obuense TaxID=1807 RepID=A0A0M2JNU3_9MYCO|nr:class I SAM-dependent methyltransferase [Mycolicibacterium obuense]KKE98585.1 SAM-dependent methlyltransferase [Mycolicibacterium obuense]TDL08402.1 class I SAM-dependent methyltransferase [Mycolicibacterium obuense]
MSTYDEQDVKAHWEARYGERERVFSGRVNPWLAEVAGSLSPGRALDLGCGEGADAVWLAENGWHVVGVDISETALQRAAEEVAERDLCDRTDFVQMNLSKDFPEGTFDLVSAQFLQSMVQLDRERIFAASARAVAPGGVLIIVDHGAAPPWANLTHDHEFPTVEGVLAQIDLDPVQWETLRAAPVERNAVGPDGQQAVLIDNLIVLRRRADG